jgi:hypothetical protein
MNNFWGKLNETVKDLGNVASSALISQQTPEKNTNTTNVQSTN